MREEELELERAIRIRVVIVIVLAVLMFLLLGFWYVLKEYKVKSVYVEGSKHYTSAQIRSMVERGWFGNNTIILSLKYSNRAVDSIPFVETMDVRIEDKNTVRIVVFEKSMAGYLRYLDRYMYFDKDGIVVENSDVATPDLPLVTGLKFDRLSMYEALPVEDPGVFQLILDTTKILAKYELKTEQIFFNDSGEMTIYFGDIRVLMGKGDLLEEKLQQVEGILPMLKGKKGILDMSSYESNAVNVSFQEEK